MTIVGAACGKVCAVDHPPVVFGVVIAGVLGVVSAVIPAFRNWRSRRKAGSD
jgi:hypothetical protein